MSPTTACLSLGTLASRAGQSFDWHRHTYDELCLVEGGAATLGHGGARWAVRGPRLFLFRRGEAHGFWNDLPGRPPLYWIIHYQVSPDLPRELPRLADPDPARRVWALAPDQIGQFKDFFARLRREQTHDLPGADRASSAWMQLLLTSVARWAEGGATALEPPRALVPLWETLRRLAAGEIAGELSALVPRYDSHRHAFRAAFGVSPRTMLARLRLERAKALLTESAEPVKTIAERTGYARQHEFARAFRRQTGLSPTAWRERARSVVAQ